MNNGNELRKIRDVVGLIGSIVGIFISILWLGGREYSAGYFGSMNIPSYYLKFSVWEYAETSWFIFLIIILITLFLEGIIIIVVKLLFGLVEDIYSRISSRIKKRQKNNNSKEEPINRANFKEYRLSVLLILSSITLFCVFSILFGGLKSIRTIGEKYGRRAVLTASPQVVLVTNSPLTVLRPNNTTASEHDVYIYENLNLLSVNDGNYFFFQQIDSSSCKPKEVIVVKENEVVSVRLGNPKIIFCNP